MKHLRHFMQFLNESQSKKLQKYFTFSVALQWYRDSKSKIAQVLGVDVDELATEDELMEQSYGLVNHVINTQTGGNEGRPENDLYGFEKFEPLEKHLIHDILHNMFHVQSKEFRKDLSNIEYTESEVFEEIEVLGIEESFMKYMNIRYPKTDFINANINMLVSYMMMAIMKNDPERIGRILDKQEEPYLEVYGVKYPVAGSAFATVYDMFKNTNADDAFDVKSSQELKKYLAQIINVATGIADSGGDRAEYPNGDYFGKRSFSDLDTEETADAIKNYFDDNIKYLTINEQDYEIDFDDVARFIDVKILEDVAFSGDDADGSVRNRNPNQLDFHDELEGKPPRKRSYDDLKKAEQTNSATRCYEIIVPRSCIQEDNYIKIKEWFDFIKTRYSHEFYVIDTERYLVIDDIAQNSASKYSNYNGSKRQVDGAPFAIMTESEMMDDATDNYESNDSFSSTHEFIDIKEFSKKSLSELFSWIFNDSDAMSILRRNFRLNDVVRNNRNMGTLKSRYDKSATITTTNPAHDYINYRAGEFQNEYSLSKNILSDNGKRLKVLLDQLRGYMIKNYAAIKQQTKTKKVFDKQMLNDFKSFKILELKWLEKALTEWDGAYVVEFFKNYSVQRTETPFCIILRTLDKYEAAKRVMDMVEFDDITNIVAQNGITNRENFQECKELINNIDDMIHTVDLNDPILMEVKDEVCRIFPFSNFSSQLMKDEASIRRIFAEKNFNVYAAAKRIVTNKDNIILYF